MRKALLLSAIVSLFAAACSGGETEPPPDIRSSAAPGGTDGSATATPTTAMVVGTCTIEPQTSCPEANLTTAPLAGADLRGADLTGANLFGADLRGVVLREANLTDADMRNTDLTGADLVDATLEGANLRDANLFQADFEGSDLTKGQIKRALTCETTLANGREDNSGCGDSPITSPAPDTSGNKVRITKFSLPETVTCQDEKVEITVLARFAVVNADEITFEVNGNPLDEDQTFDAGDTKARLPFECDKPKHRYTLFATDKKGNSASETKTVRRA